jgi:hypothetical protein
VTGWSNPPITKGTTLEHAGAIFFLIVILGVPLLIFIGLLSAGNAVAKPIMRAQRSREIENEMRQYAFDLDEQQRIARKLLDERGR